jgi:uncharacterized protein YhaN
MKILRFNLSAFGHFTGLELDMSHESEGMHFIFGLNEAGKSTALRGLRALFFGIERNSPDGFLHGNEKLRLGGLIRHSDGTTLEFSRRKGTKNTFLDRDGKAADEAELDRYIGAVDSDLFTRLFGINHECLVAGGQEILKGGGDVGQILFGAGMGGMNLREMLAALDEEASDLFKAQGQKQIINQACKEYDRLKKETAVLSRPAREYEQQANALATATEKNQLVNEELKGLRGELSRLERISRALPLLSLRRALLAELEGFQGAVILPQDFPENRAKAVSALESGRTLKKRGHEALAKLDAQIRELKIPEELLANSEMILELHQRLGMHRKAAVDLSRLEAEIRALDIDTKRLLEELRPGIPLEEARTLNIGRIRRTNIQELGNQRQALFERVVGTERSFAKTNRELRDAEAELAGLGDVGDAVNLRSAMRLAQKDGDLESKLAALRTALRRSEANADRDLKTLGLWPGDLAGLETMPIPSSETINRVEKEWLEAEQREKELSQRLEDTAREMADCERAIEALRLKGTVPSETELHEARAEREKGWQFIRDVWLEGLDRANETRKYAGESALETKYEACVQHADDLADRLRREAASVEKMAQLTAAHGQNTTSSQKLREEVCAARAAGEALRNQWTELWAEIAPLPPREMRVWVQKQVRLVEQASALRDQGETSRELEKAIVSHSEAISKALESFEENPKEQSLTAWIERADRTAERIDEAGQKRRLLQKQIVGLTRARDSAASEKTEAKAKLTDWQDCWQRAVQEVGLSESASPLEVNEFIAGCNDLIGKLDEADKLRLRIKGIKSDAALFEADAVALLKKLEPSRDPSGGEEIVTELHANLAKAKEAATKLAGHKKQRAAAEIETREAKDAVVHVEGRLEKMCRQAGCQQPEELEAIERRSRDALEKQRKLEQINERLLAESAGKSMEEFLAEIEDLNGDMVNAQIVEKQTLIVSREAERSEAEREVGSMQTLLRAMDGASRAAEMAEEAQAELAKIEEESERYIRLKIAAAIVRREVERYRSENANPLLQRAGQLFRELTLGSFSNIDTDFDESDKPVLVGVRPSGSKVNVQRMSEGARDQLFLALQLASVEKFIATSEPIPFIVDDILVAFDQEREAAVLKVLGELSKKTQVIVFTHHWHLIDLARQTLNDAVHVHDLGMNLATRL